MFRRFIKGSTATKLSTWMIAKQIGLKHYQYYHRPFTNHPTHDATST